jgi:hypothetical protein
LPHISALALRRDEARGELEIDLSLRRTKFFIGLPVKVHELPLEIKLQLEDAATGEEVQALSQTIGTMPKEERTVNLRLAWSKKTKGPPPATARLKATLTTTIGGTLDETFPLVFKPADLEPVKADAPKSDPAKQEAARQQSAKQEAAKP